MVNELTNLRTDTGLKINTNKTNIMKKSVQTEIRMKGEAAEHVPEYKHVAQLISFRDDSGKEINKRNGMTWNKFKCLGFILADKFHRN